MSWLSRFRAAVRQKRCDHSCYLEDMRDLRPSLGPGAGVACACRLCGKELWATYGLALDCTWTSRDQDTVPVGRKS